MTEYCGQPNHDPSCLCDVTILDPVEMHFCLTDVWEADRIDMDAYSVPWRTRDMAAFADTLMRAYDAYRSRESTRGVAIPNDEIRRRAMSHLQGGASMVDLCGQLHLPLDEILRALTNDQESQCWNWSETTWLKVEAVIHDDFDKHGRPALVKLLDIATNGEIGERLVRSLSEWYGAPIGAAIARRTALMRSLVHQLDSDEEVVIALTNSGHEASRAAVRKLRHRMRNEDVVESELVS